jgi:hypothetical protein
MGNLLPLKPGHRFGSTGDDLLTLIEHTIEIKEYRS